MDFLIADIGGTNLRIARYREDGSFDIHHEKYTGDLSLSEFISHALEVFATKEFSMVIGAAGPIIEGICKLTKNDIVIDEQKLREKFGTQKIYLVNDLILLGHYVSKIAERDTPHLEIVISSGTGLGLSIVAIGKGVQVFPTEYEHSGYFTNKINGPGLEELYKEFSTNDLSSEEIISRSKKASPDTSINLTIHEFCRRIIDMLRSVCFQYLPQKIYLGGTIFWELEPILTEQIEYLYTSLRKAPVDIQFPQILFLPKEAAYLGGLYFLQNFS